MTAVAGGDCSAVVPIAPNTGVRRLSVQLALLKNIGILAYVRCSLGIRVHAYDGPTIIVPVVQLGGLTPAHPTMFLCVLVY